jgi:hypothetical protein
MREVPYVDAQRRVRTGTLADSDSIRPGIPT